MKLILNWRICSLDFHCTKKNNMKPKKNSTEEEQGRVDFAEEYSYCSILTVL